MKVRFVITLEGEGQNLEACWRAAVDGFILDEGEMPCTQDSGEFEVEDHYVIEEN